MNKKAVGLSALGLLVFTAPAFAQDNKDKPASTKTEYQESKDVGKTGSSYSAETTTKSGDATKGTTDEEKTSRKSAKSEMTTETGGKSKQSAGTSGSGSRTHTTKEKSETDSSSNAAKQEKSKD